MALWQQRLQEHPCHTLLAEQSGALVGFVYWLAGAALEAQLRSLYLHPFFWRQGIGSALLKQAMGDMRHEGQRRVGLWVLANNVRAERFYLSQGFYYDGQQQSKGSGRTVYLQRRMVRALGLVGARAFSSWCRAGRKAAIGVGGGEKSAIMPGLCVIFCPLI